MNSTQLREYVIKPVLQHLNKYSQESEDLLVGTACQESLCGEYLAQLHNGPACGIYQMEPATAKDIFDNYLKYKPDLYEKVMSYYIPELTLNDNLRGNLFFATAMCRVHYLRQKGSIPKTLEGQAEYYKKYYNTELGKAKISEYISNYNKYA